MEREDSFEAIVAKAVNEVHRNRLLWRSSVRSLLFLCDFYRCAGALRHPNHSISATWSWAALPMESRRYGGLLASWRAVLSPRHGRVQPRKTPAQAKLGRGQS